MMLNKINEVDLAMDGLSSSQFELQLDLRRSISLLTQLLVYFRWDFNQRASDTRNGKFVICFTGSQT